MRKTEEKPQVVLFTGSRSGVGYYTRNLAENLNKAGYEAIVLDENSWDISKDGSLQAQLDALNPGGKIQIVHVQYPGLLQQDRELLNQVNSLELRNNQRLALTFHQFSVMKDGINPGEPTPGFSLRYKADTLPFLKKADQVIFTNDEDLTLATEFSGAHGLNLKSKSRIFPVPSNIHPLNPIPERTNDVACFARLWPKRRGQEEVIAMAEEIQGRQIPPDAPERDPKHPDYRPNLPDYDPDQKNISLHLIGDIIETGEGGGKLVLNFFKRDIAGKVYDLSEKETQALEALETQEEVMGFLADKPKRLNVELHVGESSGRVAELIGQMGYMLTMVKGGVSARNSTPIPSMQMGRIVIATKGEHTPEHYGKGAMVFVEGWQDALMQINHMQAHGQSLQTALNPQALDVDDIARRGREAASHLTPQAVAQVHENMYDALAISQTAKGYTARMLGNLGQGGHAR